PAVTAGAAGSASVTLRDVHGNIATGYRGTLHLASSDPQAVLPADYTFTAADAAVHTFVVTLNTAGAQSVTATDTASPSLTASQTGIAVNRFVPQDTAGLFDPTSATWYLRNRNAAGPPDFGPFTYGVPGWVAVAGDWNG